MKIKVLARKLHRWEAAVAALPLGLIVVTGILLQLRGILPWISPPLAKGTPGAPSLTLEQMLNVARSVPELGVQGWKEVERIDVRPRRGMATVRTHSDWNLQLDIRTGKILRVEKRAAKTLVALHEGTWFHPKVALWVFLPTGLLALSLWLSGLTMLWPNRSAKKARGKTPPVGAKTS